MDRSPARLATRVESRLRTRYGEPRKPRLDPLDELILTILSQNTSDGNRDRAWGRLRETFADWDEVRHSDPDRLEEAIRPAGLAAQKSRTILRALEAASAGGAPSLDQLEEMPDEQALRYLTAIKGVGTKTAACVLCFALGRPIIPVDTHVHRLARRLGLVPADASAERSHTLLNELVPRDLRFSLHVQLIRHGRSTCRARDPDCGTCPLRDICPRIGVDRAS